MEEREVTIDDIIEATRQMDGAEYLAFMELPGPERLARAREILGKEEE